MEALAPIEFVREISKTSRLMSTSLVHLSLVSYLKFLEEECASYVMLSTLNSALWNPVKDRLFDTLKEHLKKTFKDDYQQSGLVRTVLINQVLSGKYPSAKFRNAYTCTNSRYRPNSEDSEDFDNITKTLDSIKNHGRKCSSVCCTGAFIAETMLAVLVNEDVSHLIFDANLCDRFYRNKPIRPFMFFDIAAILVHYTMALDNMDNHGDGSKSPALTKLIINSPNLGSLASQTVYSRLMSMYPETKHYQDYPWKLSKKHSRPTSQFMMLTLSNLFDRDPNYFTNLTILKLSGECINTRLRVLGSRGGHSVIHLMSGLAHSCPVLELVDFSEVTSLCPESLIYLCYQDTYLLLHKYMYLPPKFDQDPDDGSVFQDLDSVEDPVKHQHLAYCPWCPDAKLKGQVRQGCVQDVNSQIFVIEDRLYDYIEKELKNPGSMLVHCVKVSQLIKAFNDPLQVLNSSSGKLVDEVETKSPLCYTIKELRLPCDNTDSKAWILPLLLSAMPNLTSLGEPNIYEGLKLMYDLKSIKSPNKSFKLQELVVKLDEASIVRIMAKQFMRLLSLTTMYPKWNQFVETLNPEDDKNHQACLEHWVSTGLAADVVQSEHLYGCWRHQIRTLVASFPDLRMLKITIKTGILSLDSVDIWQPLTCLKNLQEIWIHSSSRIDIVSLLSVIGSQLSEVNLMFSNQRVPTGESLDLSALGLINVVPYFCPAIKKVFYGHWQSSNGSIPHSLCDDDDYFDHQMQGYKELTHFEAAGNILQTAFLFLWERAEKLESIRISGEIVNPGTSEPPASAASTAAEADDDGGGADAAGIAKSEAVFSLRCVESYFRHNPMKWLKKFDVPVSFATLAAANKFLELLPISMDYIAMLTITIDMNDVISEEAVEDAISTVFTRMVNFKLSCKRREVEQNCQIKWKWKPEGLLTILLNQQLMTSMAEFVQP